MDNSNENENIDKLCNYARPPRGEWIWVENDHWENKWAEQVKYRESVPDILAKLKNIDDPKVFKTMVHYLYDYPWVAEKSREIAITYVSTHEYEIDVINEIKDSFTAKHDQISEAGRKKLQINNNQVKFSSLNLNEPVVPWRSDLAMVALFEYFVRTATFNQLQIQWPFVTPTTLNIVDDHDPGIKQKGCEIIQTLMEQTDRTFFKSTGLVQVMWDALTPCLSYLPPGTPDGESILLVGKCIDALIVAAQVDSSSNNNNNVYEKLDELIREGIVRGMNLAGEKVTVALMLLVKLEKIINILQMRTIRHLGALVTILVHVLADPFGNAFEPLLNQACSVMILLLKYCWPRMEEYKFEILNGLIKAWRNLSEKNTITKEKIIMVLKLLNDCTNIDINELKNESDLFNEL